MTVLTATRRCTLDVFARTGAACISIKPSTSSRVSPRARLTCRNYAARVLQPRQWSSEQLAIVERARTHNIVVSARPGSGKTATAEAIVAANPDKSIAVLTYSKRLQIETSKRLKQYPKCSTYTFHRLAGKLFDTVVHNDRELSTHRLDRTEPASLDEEEAPEIIILDEMQDCTEPLFWLACLFVDTVTRARGKPPRIVVLGDEKQAIYEFRGADARFLSLCPIIMSDLSPDPWELMTLNKSFRLSHQNANFINKAFLKGENYIVGSHKGRKPLYIHADLRNVELLARELAPLIRKHGVQNTAILGTAVRTNRRISRLTNYLTDKEQMPVAEPVSDDVALDDLVIRGKICVSTIHQFKGSERDLVILFGLDDYYYEIAKDEPDDRCPNDIFVGLTRASKQLVVIHNTQQQIMPFVDVEQLRKTATHIFLSPQTDESFETRPPTKTTELGLILPKTVAASNIARHIPDETLHAIISRHANIDVVSEPLPPSQHIRAPDKVVTDTEKQHFEAVSDINGMAVVAGYELGLCGTLATLGHRAAGGRKGATPTDIPDKPYSRAVWLCRKACRYLSDLSTYRSRLMQMWGHPFDWLVPFLTIACDRLRDEFQGVVQRDLEFEYEMELPLTVPDETNPAGAYGGLSSGTIIKARADIIQKTRPKSRNDKSTPTVLTVWEIKFVQQLTLEHVVQTCVYGHLWSVEHAGIMPRIMLYNVRNNEKWEISPKDSQVGLRVLVEEVLRAKYTSRKGMSDEEFLNICAKARDEVQEVKQQ